MNQHQPSVRHTVAFVKRFSGCERGAVAMIVAIAMIPLIIAGGLAVDLSRAYLVQSRLAHSLDAAGLAAGSKRTASSEAAYLEAQFTSFFTANYPDTELGTTHDLTFVDNGGIITVTGKATVETAFMSIVGVSSITVSATAEIEVETNGLELVMVLDNSLSMGMGTGKMESMQEAALDLIDILFEDEAEPDLLKVGLVPFDTTVNIGTGNIAYVNQTAGTFDNWAQLQSPAPPIGLADLGNTPNPFDSNLLTMTKMSSNFIQLASLDGAFNPALLNATQTSPHPRNAQGSPFEASRLGTLIPPDSDLTSPEAPNPDVLVAWGWGGGGGGGGTTTWEGCVMARAYPYDVNDSDTATGGNWEPYYNTENSSDRNGTCPRPITALTNVRATLEDEINAMSALGATHINLGAIWGWRVLSSSGPFTEGAAYDDADWNKAAIVLTDGDNTFYNNSSSFFSAYEPGDITASELDDRLLEVCTGMKNAGITVYTIAFGSSISASTQTMLESCATSEDHYYESPDSDTLTTAFRAIGAELKQLHLSK